MEELEKRIGEEKLRGGESREWLAGIQGLEILSDESRK